MNYYVKLGMASFFLSMIPAFAAAVAEEEKKKEEEEPVVVVLR